MRRLSLWCVNLTLVAGLALGDSLWTATAVAKVSDPTAMSVGDVLTIVVRQVSAATRNQQRKTAKKSDIDAKIGSFLFSPGASSALTKAGQLPSLNASTANNFEGGGNISDVNNITDRFSVRVVDVLPNGTFALEGRRSSSVSGETSTIILRAVVRKEDVLPDNTVSSTQLADLTLRYESKGNLNDTQKRGWFGKVWDKVNPL